jgi:hypothetical protein
MMSRMTNAAADQMQHVNDMMMASLKEHFLGPALVITIAIAILVIAVEILKATFRRKTRKVLPGRLKRPF